MYWLRLIVTPTIGSRTALALLKHFGLPEHIFEATSEQLKAVRLSTKQRSAIQQEPPKWADHLEQTREWLAQSDRHHFVHLADVQYPQQLLHLSDPPLGLFVLAQPYALTSCIEKSDNGKAVAIVGSRRATPQGIGNAQAFAQSLAEQGMLVVSGLALGVDAAAHQGALDSGRPAATLAVVGTGVDRVYPAKNKSLAHAVVDNGGMLVSEFPLGTPPVATNFPKRNRIIAGLTKGTLVVEAALQSGSLITARLASEIGKEVFAIPGSIHSTQAKGCHRLIKEGAKLVETTEDIVSELESGFVVSKQIFSAMTEFEEETQEDKEETTLEQEEHPLLTIMGFDPMHIDQLLERTSLSTAEAQAQLLDLELSQRVQRLPGGWFQRLVKA